MPQSDRVRSSARSSSVASGGRAVGRDVAGAGVHRRGWARRRTACACGCGTCPRPAERAGGDLGRRPAVHGHRREWGPVLAALPNLRLVQTLTAGYESMLPLLPDGVALANAVGVHDTSTSELAVGLAAAVLRGFPDFVRDGRRTAGGRPQRRRSLADRRVLVVGFGGVGRAVATPADRVRGARDGRGVAGPRPATGGGRARRRAGARGRRAARAAAASTTWWCSPCRWTTRTRGWSTRGSSPRCRTARCWSTWPAVAVVDTDALLAELQPAVGCSPVWT